MIRYLLLSILAIVMYSCQGPQRQENSAVSEIDTISDDSDFLNQNNPFRMRDSIKHFAIIPNISLKAKLKIFQSLQDSLQKVISHENKQKFAEIEKYNYLIIQYIVDLIENHNIAPRSLARKSIKYIQSSDRKVGILSWDENTGSAFHSFINVLTYRTKDNKYKTFHLEWINRKFEYPSYAGEIKQIRLLGHSESQSIYMLYSEGIGCSDCLNKAFISLALQKDTIDMNYPLFVHESDLLVETKNENLLQFEYKPLLQEIVLRLVTDTIIDNTVVPVDTITKKWKFDGAFFQVVEADEN